MRLYEQRTNGNNFLAVCAPNAITTTTAVQFPDAVGAILAGKNIAQTWSAVQTYSASVQVSGTQNNGTAASPWNDFLTRTSFGEIFKIAHPGTTFGSTWTLQTGATSDILTVVSSSGGTTLSMNNTAGGFAVTTNNAGATFGSAASPWLQGFFGSVAANATSGAVTGYDGSVFRYSINNGTAGSNAGSAMTVKNFSGTNVFDVAYGGTTTVANLTSTGTVAMNTFTATSFTGDLLPISSGTQNIGGTNTIGTIFGTTYQSDDGAVLRMTISNPGAGSNAGAGIIMRNAAGAIVFRVYYNGVIETTYSGGGNEHACFTAGGTLYRGAGGVC